jgi:hypothetical protein
MGFLNQYADFRMGLNLIIARIVGIIFIIFGVVAYRNAQDTPTDPGGKNAKIGSLVMISIGILILYLSGIFNSFYQKLGKKGRKVVGGVQLASNISGVIRR